MKKIIPLISMVFAVYVTLFTACASKSTMSKNAHLEDMKSFEQSDAWNKLDGRFKQAYKDAIEQKDENRLFECLMKIKKNPTSQQKEKLVESGYKYRSIAGKILSGSISAKDVPIAAGLDFVAVMELAVPLSPKN